MVTQHAEDATVPLTVGKLRELIAGLDDGVLVLGHAGWDFPITEWVLDDEGFVLFLDHESTASMVNSDWLSRHTDGKCAADQTKIPTVNDLVGIDPDFTGDMTTDEYIAWLRE